MHKSLDGLDLQVLKELFMKETREYLAGLQQDAPLHELEAKRAYIKMLGSLIDKKTKMRRFRLSGLSASDKSECDFY